MSTNPNQYPANALWVELSTRITTQSLHYRFLVMKKQLRRAFISYLRKLATYWKNIQGSFDPKESGQEYCV